MEKPRPLTWVFESNTRSHYERPSPGHAGFSDRIGTAGGHDRSIHRWLAVQEAGPPHVERFLRMTVCWISERSGRRTGEAGQELSDGHDHREHEVR